MITHRLYLKTPKNEESLILVELRKDGKKLRVSTGITIKVEFWDDDKKTLKKGCADFVFLSQKLLHFSSVVAKETMIADAKEHDLDTLKNAILGSLGKADQIETKGVLKFYKWWAQHSFGNHNPNKHNWNHYTVFEEFMKGKDIPFEEVDYEFYLKFKAYLDNNKKYKPNTAATHLRDLKAVMTEARNRGMHNSTAYLAIKKKFENVDTTYMTMDEIKKLSKHKVSGVKEMVRDLFLLGCHTAMRYQDYSTLKMEHIVNGNIVFKTKKTGTTVVIPAHPRVIELLTKWGGKAPDISQVNLNKFIKEICKEMGIFNDMMPVKDGKTTVLRERWSQISTHTARRSGATNMYIAGIPAQSIMQITGHSTEANFMKYLRITKEQNAKMLAENDFFKK